MSLPRGFRTWGDIEIENDEESEEEREGHRILEDGFESDFSIDGTTYRLPEKGIKLDFLEKIHMYNHFHCETDNFRERLRPRSLDMLSDQVANRPMVMGNVLLFLSGMCLTIEASSTNGRCSQTNSSPEKRLQARCNQDFAPSCAR